MVGVVATLGSMLAWGGVADRKGTVPVLVAAGILGVAGLSLHAIAADHLTVLLASVLVGVSVGAVEVAFSLLIANHVPAHHQAAATAGSNAIFGIRGIIAPVAVVALLQVGVIDLDGALALCVAAALGGALLYLRAATEGRGAAERAVKGQVNLHVGGHQTSRLTDTRSPRRRTGDDPIAQASGTTPFPAVASARR
jgi:MFS family permease